MEKFKFTKMERYWILYDVGNSAFILLTSTLLPIYFEYLASTDNLSEVEYLAYWGYSISIVTLLVAIFAPILGTIADTKGYKKKLFLGSVILGTMSCAVMGIATSWLAFLIIFMLAKFGVSTSIVIYDSMLPDVTDPERMDVVSSQGYAWGYIGSCIPFGIGLALVLGGGSVGLSLPVSMLITFVLIAVWWLIVAMPLFKNYKQKYYIEENKYIIRKSFGRIGETLKDIKNEKHIFLFLLAFFFYIDGVYTIIDMATAYGTALGLDSTGLLLALLVTQFVAFPASIIFGMLSKKVDNTILIRIAIVAYTGIAVIGFFLDTQAEFWLLAVLVGLFQGGIQAMSRSYFAQIIPPEKAGEYFGLFDICGKGAAFVGTSMVSFISQATGSVNMGVGGISILFIVGFILFHFAMKAAKEKNKVKILENN